MATGLRNVVELMFEIINKTHTTIIISSSFGNSTGKIRCRSDHNVGGREAFGLGYHVDVYRLFCMPNHNFNTFI